jgi:hypothetical protein
MIEIYWHQGDMKQNCGICDTCNMVSSESTHTQRRFNLIYSKSRCLFSGSIQGIGVPLWQMTCLLHNDGRRWAGPKKKL